MEIMLFDSSNLAGLMPHGYCIKWSPEILWTYVVSDSLIALAYFSIPAVLAFFVIQREGLHFRWIYLMFSAFILACGTTHLMSIVLLWQPMYGLDAMIKALTAVVSVATAILLVRLIPDALKLPSHQQLESEISERKAAQLELQESESRLKALSQQLTGLVEAIPDAILFSDAQGQLQVVNEHAIHLCRLHNLDWRGKTYRELAFWPLDQLEKQIRLFSNEEMVWEAGHLIMFEDQTINDEGRLIDVEVRKTPIFRENGQRKGMVILCRDISNIKRAEKELRIAETTIESQEGILITDENNIILRVNRAFTRLTGYLPEEVIGQRPSILKSGRHDPGFYRALWNTLEREKFWQGEVWDRRKNGEIYPKWLTIHTVCEGNGRVSNYVATFSDLSQHKAAQDALHRLAYYDPLTDLPNRRLLQEQLQQALSNCAISHQYGAVLMSDLDHFKTINDTMGHQFGDQVLIETAARIKASLRQGDIVGRLGGDEFIILLQNLGDEENQASANAEEVGQKILQAITPPISIDDQDRYCSISIGVSLFHENSNSVDEILKCADAALYQAKDAGRTTLRFYDPEMLASLESNMHMEFDLHHALQLGQLELYYQAQVDCSGNVFGAEVLLRWLHPLRGMVSPVEFIPIAEESGLILPIGKWVLQTACEQLKAWGENPLTEGLHLAVNISARQFRQCDFVEQIFEILENTGVNPTKLKLELTESLVLHNVTDTIEKMHELKKTGVRFSMDDFGTGYSSLAYLKQLPLTQLKIDRSFVRDILVDPSDAVIAQTIIGMGHNLGLNVIAEGVETEEQRACLEQIGCDAFQGYLFNRPQPLGEFELFVAKNAISLID
ncbi:putative bifunctional diguanylate cyclase/phosphodiesterase (plasmid) [Methylomonas sp. 2BW1-5-20]|uniref:putative bifunctional diguanylate cyclase/phosphodiesterase n=1 Tax=Methylomonas sp. 2BW1-5-20 TaxID=3376686 RepID=UPI0040526BF9